MFYGVFNTPAGSKVQSGIVEVHQRRIGLCHVDIQRVVDIRSDAHVVVLEHIVTDFTCSVQCNISQQYDFACRIAWYSCHFFKCILPSVFVYGTINTEFCMVVIVVEVGTQCTPYDTCQTDHLQSNEQECLLGFQQNGFLLCRKRECSQYQQDDKEGNEWIPRTCGIYGLCFEDRHAYPPSINKTHLGIILVSNERNNNHTCDCYQQRKDTLFGLLGDVSQAHDEGGNQS